MKFISTYFHLFLLLSLFACNQVNKKESEVQHISITIERNSILNLSSFCDSIELIPLQTTSENLISKIKRIIYSSGKYYVSTIQGFTNGQIHIYDSNGNFLSKIHRIGNGPGEYVELSDFKLTPEGNIKIISFFKIINYDSVGNFLNEKRTNQPIKEMYSLSDSSYLLYNFDAPLHGYKLLSIVDKEDNIVKQIFNIDKKDVNKSDLNFDKNAFSSYNDTVYFNYPYCDTIYAITNNKIIPKYFIDYGKKQLPPDLFEETDATKEMDQKLKTLSSFARSFSFGVDSNFICIGSIDEKYTGYLTLYFKQSNRILTGQKIKDDLFLKGNIISLSSRNLPWIIDNGDLLYPIEPRYLLKGYKTYWSHLSEPERIAFQTRYPKLVEVCKSLKEDDNPVLLRIHIKGNKT